MSAESDPRKLADTVREAQKWRELVNQWTDACEEVYDAAKAAGDEYPALLWQLADRGHSVGAEFGFALDRLDALVALAEQQAPSADIAWQWRDAFYEERDAHVRERAARESAERERDEAVRDVHDMSTGTWGSSAVMVVALKHRAESAEAALRAEQARADELEKALREIADLSSQDVPFTATGGVAGAMRKIARDVLAASTGPEGAATTVEQDFWNDPHAHQ